MRRASTKARTQSANVGDHSAGTRRTRSLVASLAIVGLFIGGYARPTAAAMGMTVDPISTDCCGNSTYGYVWMPDPPSDPTGGLGRRNFAAPYSGPTGEIPPDSTEPQDPPPPPEGRMCGCGCGGEGDACGCGVVDGNADDGADQHDMTPKDGMHVSVYSGEMMAGACAPFLARFVHDAHVV